MNVIFITFVDITGNGGQNVYSREVATALSHRSNTKLTLVCPEPSSRLPTQLTKCDNIKFISSKDRRSTNWHAQAQIEAYRILRELNSNVDLDVIASPLKASTIAPPLIAWQTKTPYVLLVEGLLSQNVRDIAPFPAAGVISDGVVIFNALVSDMILVAFNGVRDWLTSFPFIGESSIKIINHGVDRNRFTPIGKNKARESIDIECTKDELIIGYVGSFKKRHRLDLLIKAINRLQTDDIPIKCIFVGEGENRDKMSRLAAKCGISEKIMFTGYIPDSELSKYICASDIAYGMRDANHWSNPLKIYEYLACNRPVIAYRTPHTSFIKKYDFGILIDDTTVDSIESAIKNAYYRFDKENCPFAKSREFIVENYDWANHADAIASIYQYHQNKNQ